MLFRKNKHEDNEELLGNHDLLALTSLIPLCNGRVRNDAFIIENHDIYVYADVVSLKDDVAQIVYQLHHEWLETPIVETVAASGDSLEDAIHKAAQSFYENVLIIYLKAVQEPNATQRVHILTQGPRDYYIYRGKINGVGQRKGILEGDFWDMLQDDLLANVADEKAYWIKIFTSKNKDNVICEVRMNGKEISALSEQLLQYAEDWDCMDTYHTEKQGILLIQAANEAEVKLPQKNDVTIYTKEAIALFDKCKSKEEYKTIQRQIYLRCRDESLASEIYSLIPEFYCMFAYAKVEFGNALFLVCKGEETKQINQSALSSFESIRTCVYAHLSNGTITRDTIENVLQYSANAKAIKKALEEGNEMEELMIPGVGIRISQNYKLR